MATHRIDIDLRSFGIEVVGNDGRRHQLPDVIAAGRAAEAGDPDGVALWASLEHPLPEGEVPPDGEAHARALLERIMHDCPECRAARERGEEPILVTGEELALIRATPELAGLFTVERTLPISWCGTGAEVDGEPPVAWRGSDLISFGPGPRERRRERRRARARARRRVHA